MYLHQIDATLTLLLEKRDQLLEAALGEITPEVEAAEQEIQNYLAASVEKIEAALVVIQSLENDAEILANEEARLYERRVSVENNLKRLRGLVALVIERVFDSKVKTPKFTASVSASKPSTKVDLAPDADALKCYEQRPDLFLKPPLPSLSKTAAAETQDKPAWLLVETVPGKKSLRIR